MVGSVVGSVVEVDREEAARAAAEELSKSIYRQHEPGLMQRALAWLSEQATRLLEVAAGVAPGGLGGLLLLLGLLAAAVVVVRWRLGPMAGRRSRGSSDARVFGIERRSATEHRQAASAAAAAEDWDTAVKEAFRGLVADLTERTVLEDRPGRTADEAARELAEQAPAVTAAARVFDEVSYGDRKATEHAYATVRDADAAAMRVRAV